MDAGKPIPWYIALAFRVVADYFDNDLDRWPSSARNRVFVAALDAELRGERAVKDAVYEEAKAVIAEWRRKTKARQRKQDKGDE